MSDVLTLGPWACPPARVVRVEWRTRVPLGRGTVRLLRRWARALLDVPGHARLVSVDVIDARQVAALARHQAAAGADVPESA